MHHISHMQSDFVQYTLAPGKVGLGGNQKSDSRKECVVLDQLGIRTVIIQTSDVEITLHNVLHVPDANERFFSINMLLIKKGSIQFKDSGFVIYLYDQPVARGYSRNNLFWMDAEVLPKINTHRAINPAADLQIWHECMGHMSYNTLQ
jgi:hypothetical protein